MLVEDRLNTEIDHDKWSSGPLTQTANWNGKELYILDSELYKDVICHFSKARFMEDNASINTLVVREKQSQSSVGYDVNVKTDSDGKTTATATVEHRTETRDDKGNTDRVSVQGRGSVDNNGKTSGEVTVRYEKTY